MTFFDWVWNWLEKWEKDHCSKCGQASDAQRDIRIVNSRRGYTLPEPDYCSACWQVR